MSAYQVRAQAALTHGPERHNETRVLRVGLEVDAVRMEEGRHIMSSS